jgi:hypothetical protein
MDLFQVIQLSEWNTFMTGVNNIIPMHPNIHVQNPEQVGFKVDGE